MSSIFNLEDGDKVTVNTTDFRLGLNLRWNKILSAWMLIGEGGWEIVHQNFYWSATFLGFLNENEGIE